VAELGTRNRPDPGLDLGLGRAAELAPRDERLSEVSAVRSTAVSGSKTRRAKNLRIVGDRAR
jgi:hypothetical protein